MIQTDNSQIELKRFEEDIKTTDKTFSEQTKLLRRKKYDRVKLFGGDRLKENGKPPEQNVITKFITDRIRKGLGVNAIIVGAPGSGKSYICLRLMEKILEDLYGEELSQPRKHIVDNVPDAFGFIRHVRRPGMPLTIEEVSVLASSRRSMSRDNVSINYLLDTVRKKQVVLLMNAPTIQSVDKHIQRMSHLYIEALRINKTKGFATIKAFKLQHNQGNGKVYMHRFHNEGRDIYYNIVYKPSQNVIENYEKKKDEFLNRLYELMEAESTIRRGKVDKILNVNKKKDIPEELTAKEWELYMLFKKGYNNRQISEKTGIPLKTSAAIHNRICKKLRIKGKIPIEIVINSSSKSGQDNQQINNLGNL